MGTNMGDLDNNILGQILRRLPCDKFVFQIKLVSKRWCTLVSEPYFIGRFLRLQSDNQTPKVHAVIDHRGRELFPTKAFERFQSFLSSKEESRVLATCNDLVLCSEKFNDDRDFYICNPRTMQLFSLPPPPRSHNKIPPWGFICEPYYYKEASRDAGFNINADYRFKVVKILHPCIITECYKFKIQVFSSETGEWKEIAVPCPRGFKYGRLKHGASFGNNGILYWVAQGNLLALRTPLFFNNKINCGGASTDVDDDDQYQFHVIDSELPENHSFYKAGRSFFCQLRYIGVYGGRVRLHDFKLEEKPPLLCVWELKEDELDQMVLDGVGKLGSEHVTSYALDQTMIPEESKYCLVTFIAYDSVDLDVVYANIGKQKVKCNIRTGSWSKMAETSFDGHFGRQIVLPWWPTPVPRLPQRSV